MVAIDRGLTVERRRERERGRDGILGGLGWTFCTPQGRRVNLTTSTEHDQEKHQHQHQDHSQPNLSNSVHHRQAGSSLSRNSTQALVLPGSALFD
ncbi:hypothetical protein E2P81_ATG06335 [Venturia nashicola]|uniref:Uncharacterized protein n=1 Tax=Venturia nashicola TaxID=86259 RepID=A0A4Z1NV10_9PEZI|nr:hypothetical protein E6O75_ATG06488 [Venturia nashicola]TLD27989.1 hypothetical protein E2P81_ATG06335 [Venturia nashicola]